MKSEVFLRNAQRIGLYIAIGTIFLNFCAFGWSIIQTNIQTAETRDLAKLTSALEDRVNRLAINLDQKVSRLNRLRELVAHVFQSVYKLNQRMQQGYEKSAGVTYEDGFDAGSVSIEEIIAHNVNIETSAIELFAIASVAGDDQLLSRTEQFISTMPTPEEYTTHENWLERLGEFRSAAIALHERVYQLLEQITEVR